MPLLNAPFPYPGGKRRIAASLWRRFGPVAVYTEGYAGSCACLLRSPYGPAGREIVSDTNGFICNFWRALRAEPDAVARWADYPSFHHDLTARHEWLMNWGREESHRLLKIDPETNDLWYDVKAAGWWCWGMSLWIGAGWCTDVSLRKDEQLHDKRPYVRDTVGGRGVSAQRATHDKIPRVSDRGGGHGVAAQALIRDQRPGIGKGGGSGIHADSMFDGSPVGSGERLLEWFEALAQRFGRVITLNRDWQSAVTDTLLQHTPSGPKPEVGVLLDPPYRTTTGRSDNLYQSDADGTSEDTAEESYMWAVENGERYRIAYCQQEVDGKPDFPIPAGWEVERYSFGRGRDAAIDLVMYSPRCDRPGEQAVLL